MVLWSALTAAQVAKLINIPLQIHYKWQNCELLYKCLKCNNYFCNLSNLCLCRKRYIIYIQNTSLPCTTNSILMILLKPWPCFTGILKCKTEIYPMVVMKVFCVFVRGISAWVFSLVQKSLDLQAFLLTGISTAVRALSIPQPWIVIIFLHGVINLGVFKDSRSTVNVHSRVISWAPW